MAWYVYMLLCGDGTLYTGMTDDVPRRLRVHRSGRGAKYTRGRGPLTLVYVQEQPSRSAALVKLPSSAITRKVFKYLRSIGRLTHFNFFASFYKNFQFDFSFSRV